MQNAFSKMFYGHVMKIYNCQIFLVEQTLLRGAVTFWQKPFSLEANILFLHGWSMATRDDSMKALFPGFESIETQSDLLF